MRKHLIKLAEHGRSISPECKFFETKFIDLSYRWLNIINPSYGSRIIDLGIGFGYLSHICKTERYCDVHGIDEPNRDPAFSIMNQILEVPVTEHKIEKFQEIPFEGKYDIIIATLICFARDGLCSDNPVPWNIDAHKFFLRNCMYHLRRDGKMFFKFNEPMTEEAKDLYASKGDTDRKSVV